MAWRTRPWRSLVPVVVALIVAAWLPASGGVARQPRGAGDDGTAYTSPSYGYRLTWDPEVWTRIATPAEPSPDALLLGHDGDRIAVAFRGYDDGAGNHLTCLRDAFERLHRLGWTLVPLAVLPPATGRTGSSALFEGERRLPDPALDAFYLECRTLVPGRAVLQVIAHFGDDASEYAPGVRLFEALIARLELPGHGEGERRTTPPEAGDGSGGRTVTGGPRWMRATG